MWNFYYDVTAAASSTYQGDSAAWAFAVFVILTSLIVLAPPYFEKREK